MCMMMVCCSIHLHLCLKQIDTFFRTLGNKILFPFLFKFSCADSLYIISKLTPYRKIFSTIYNMPCLVSISETVWRSLLTLHYIILFYGSTNFYWFDLGTENQTSKIHMFGPNLSWKPPQLPQMSCMIYFYYQHGC